jgi:two-component system, LytTR family, response regulator
MKVAVVDDEPLARRRLRAMLGEHPDVEIVAECEDAAQAARLLPAAKPDLVFLDIQMPETDGFAFLEQLSATARPYVIFVTAHAEHAVRAFDADAVDYLLKPYDRTRLARSLDRARAACSAYLERVAVSIGRRTVFVATADIDWIQADGNYLRLCAGAKTHLIRSTLSGLEPRLDPSRFVRVHRSYIVRIDQVRELRTLESGEHRLTLVDGTEVPVSHQYRNRLPR